MTRERKRRSRTEPKEWARGSCLCGAVEIEIGVPARWAWHDHSRESRIAHGAAYATYVGCWKNRFRIVKGEAEIARYAGPSPEFAPNETGPLIPAKAGTQKNVQPEEKSLDSGLRRNERDLRSRPTLQHDPPRQKQRLRSFCRRCGTPIAYERSDPNMINVPRALFAGRTGREPLYHVGIAELADWTWRGERLVPLKGFPGVVWTRSKPKRRDVL